MKVGIFDIEGNGLYPEVTQVWCAVVKTLHEDTIRSFDPSNINDLGSYLSTFDVLVGHNSIGYDFPTLKKVLGIEYTGKRVDTLLMSRLQRPTRVAPYGIGKFVNPHSVEAWGYRLGSHKIEHNEWDAFSPAMLERCRQDVLIQEQIYDALLEEGAGEGWGRAHKLNSVLFTYLQKQEDYGWLVDRDHIDRCFVALDRWVDRIDRAVVPRLPIVYDIEEVKKAGEWGYVRKPFKKDGKYASIVERFYAAGTGEVGTVVGPFSRVCFRPVDLDKNAEVKDILLGLGWEPEEWNTNDKGERTSPKFSKTDAFKGIQGALGKLIAKRIQCRQRKGILEGWVEAIRPDGRIGARVAGMASTGRLRHAEIVNVPSPHSKAFFAKQMRQVFTAQPGWVLVGTDSKGNQIRQLAARMGDPEFTQAVLYGNSKDGTDLHSLNQRRSGAASRNLAKNFFYGFIFGAGDKKIGGIIGGDAAAGKALKEQYLNELPKLRELIDRITAEWRATAQKKFNKRYNRTEYKNGFIRGLDGRPILVEDEHTILVYYLQSDEAIQMATAYIMLNKWLERRGYIWGKDYGSVIWMHDEWQIECREAIAEEVASLGNEAIAWAGRYYNIPCPHEGESKIGRNWYETH